MVYERSNPRINGGWIFLISLCVCGEILFGLYLNHIQIVFKPRLIQKNAGDIKSKQQSNRFARVGENF